MRRDRQGPLKTGQAPFGYRQGPAILMQKGPRPAGDGATGSSVAVFLIPSPVLTTGAMK